MLPYRLSFNGTVFVFILQSPSITIKKESAFPDLHLTTRTSRTSVSGYIPNRAQNLNFHQPRNLILRRVRRPQTVLFYYKKNMKDSFGSTSLEFSTLSPSGFSRLFTSKNTPAEQRPVSQTTLQPTLRFSVSGHHERQLPSGDILI